MERDKEEEEVDVRRKKSSSKAPYPIILDMFLFGVCHPNQTRHATAATKHIPCCSRKRRLQPCGQTTISHTRCKLHYANVVSSYSHSSKVVYLML
jgi:hypothetical protein